MAHEVQHGVVDLKQPSSGFSRTPEQTYWQTFKSPLQIPSPTNHAVNHISQPSANHIQLGSNSESFAVTTGARVQLYSHRTRKLLKTITRFSDTAHSGEIRYDGRVLVAGDEAGSIQVFDTNSRAILKTWKEHKQPVWVTRWHPREPTTLLSGSDDNTLRLWDLPAEHSTSIFRGHLDYVRSAAFLPTQTSPLLLSGSYDRTVRLWDSRTPQKAVMTFAHTSPVESVLPLLSGQQVLASASNQIAVLDLLAAKPLHLIANHQKTVTSLCLANDSSRLVSGALDGHMKVFETNAWNIVAGSKYPSPILSLSIIASGPSLATDKHIAVGLQSGILSIRTRLSGPEKAKDRARRAEMEALVSGTLAAHDKAEARKKKRGKGWEIRLRGREYKGEDADIVVDGNERKKRKKPKEWEKLLHAGRYREALDVLMSGQSDDRTIFALFTTLRHRAALRASLEEKDEVALQPILKWVHRNIAHPAYVPMCVEISMQILDLYSKYLCESKILQDQVQKLRERVRKEHRNIQQATVTMGMLELLASPSQGTIAANG
ncbi:MAG: hypothetical protein Q9227_001344 [Pyrenula ochraceoflavens]